MRLALMPQSRPARGARIETAWRTISIARSMSRPARGARIETSAAATARGSAGCRAPHGARGLKRQEPAIAPLIVVAPRTGRAD